MKRPASWENHASTSSDDSSDSDSENEKFDRRKGSSKHVGGSKKLIDTMPEANMKKKRHGGMDYEALSKHGYHGGPSVLKVPLRTSQDNDERQSWLWSTGKEGTERDESVQESLAEQERTRAAAHGEGLLHMQANLRADKRAASFSQKEKRKRDIGQASRGKSYVEEEKRLLRDSGIYSGFDS